MTLLPSYSTPRANPVVSLPGGRRGRLGSVRFVRQVAARGARRLRQAGGVGLQVCTLYIYIYIYLCILYMYIYGARRLRQGGGMGLQASTLYIYRYTDIDI